MSLSSFFSSFLPTTYADEAPEKPEAEDTSNSEDAQEDSKEEEAEQPAEAEEEEEEPEDVCGATLLLCNVADHSVANAFIA
jgi:ubiquinol-cytochrome c reductase subunit 6